VKRIPYHDWLIDFRICPNCGGYIYGDGLWKVKHCEKVKLTGKELPKDGPILCDIDNFGGQGSYTAKA
jgi:hypothetical protein